MHACVVNRNLLVTSQRPIISSRYISDTLRRERKWKSSSSHHWTRGESFPWVCFSSVSRLLPLAYGWGGADPFVAPMALALGFGLFFATPLTLILIPCLYVIEDDIRRSMKVKRQAILLRINKKIALHKNKMAPSQSLNEMKDKINHIIRFGKVKNSNYEGEIWKLRHYGVN